MMTSLTNLRDKLSGTARPQAEQYSVLAEDVRADGQGTAVGELITCAFCSAVWVATGFTAGLLLLTRTTRIAMGTLAALVGADFLHFAHARLDPS